MKVLPFYTSTGMRDAEKVGSQDALLCPRHKLLPFQIQREHSADTFIDEIKLVDCSGNETDILDYIYPSADLVNDWENGPSPTYNFNVFNDSSGDITEARTTDTSNDFCYSNTFSLATGDTIFVDVDITLGPSAAAPNIFLGNFIGPNIYSAKQVVADGANTLFFTATGNYTGGVVRLMVENEAGNDTYFVADFNATKRIGYSLDEFTTYDFITYNGEPLSTLLPYGVYYLKITDDNTTWYSEWFSVQDIQPQLISGWPAETYATFNTSGTDITSAIAAGSSTAYTGSFSAHFNEVFIVTYDFTLNSGDAPQMFLTDASLLGTYSNAVTLEPGLNEVELIHNTANAGVTSGLLALRLLNSTASNFSLLNVSVRRKAGDYVHLEFTNSRDFNNGDKSIYYVGGFTQQAYLRAYENTPSHETIEVGGEKNGEFKAEKIVSKYVRSIVSYESRSMYNALRMLPLHSSVKILTEDGVEYTPAVGNITVPPIDWGTFDTGTLRIEWNEVGQQWTNSMDNIS
jgi:hypothetical protein